MQKYTPIESGRKAATLVACALEQFGTADNILAEVALKLTAREIEEGRMLAVILRDTLAERAQRIRGELADIVAALYAEGAA